MARRRGVTSQLYAAARLSNDIGALASGNPRRMARSPLDSLSYVAERLLALHSPERNVPSRLSRSVRSRRRVEAFAILALDVPVAVTDLNLNVGRWPT